MIAQMINPNIIPKINPHHPKAIAVTNAAISPLLGISFAKTPSKIKDKKGNTNALNETIPTIIKSF